VEHFRGIGTYSPADTLTSRHVIIDTRTPELLMNDRPVAAGTFVADMELPAPRLGAAAGDLGELEI